MATREKIYGTAKKKIADLTGRFAKYGKQNKNIVKVDDEVSSKIKKKLFLGKSLRG